MLVQCLYSNDIAIHMWAILSSAVEKIHSKILLKNLGWNPNPERKKRKKNLSRAILFTVC